MTECVLLTIFQASKLNNYPDEIEALFWEYLRIQLMSSNFIHWWGLWTEIQALHHYVLISKLEYIQAQIDELNYDITECKQWFDGR